MLRTIWEVILDLPAKLQKRNRYGKWFNRILFFFNWICIIYMPCVLFVAHQHASNLDLLFWFAICIYTYHWYFSCEFPWQKRKGQNNDQTDTCQ